MGSAETRAPPARRYQSTLMFASLIVFAHLVISVFWNAANWSGPMGMNFAPSVSSRFWISSERMIFCTSALSRATIAGDMPAGPNRPIQLLTSKPGTVSAIVGVSGSAGEHVGDCGNIALVRHVHDIHPGHRLEELAGEMARRADASRAIAQLAGLRTG